MSILKILRIILRFILVAVGLVLIIDCAVLMVVGKINFSTVVPLLLGAILIIHGIYWQLIRNYVTRNRWLKLGWYSLWVIFIIWLISFVVFIQSLQQRIKLSEQPLPQVAAIIILGSRTVAGKPTPTLAKRLDTAASVIDAQPSAVVVTSGGVGFGRTRSEANIMATYLHDTHSVPFDQILQEDSSTIVKIL